MTGAHSKDPDPGSDANDEQPKGLLKRALESIPETKPARAEFRDALRTRFLQGAFQEEQTPGARMQRALDAAGSPRANADFREELRAQFVGAAAPQSSTPTAESAEEYAVRELAQEDSPDEDDSRGRGAGSLRIVRWIAPLALAAAALMLLLNPAIGSKPEWEVVEFPRSAAPLWDGQPVSAVELLPEDRRWNSIETGSERLRLKWSDELLVEVGADSQVSWEPLLKADPAAADDPQASPCLRAGKGGVNFTSRDSDNPVRLFVETPEAKIELRGTTVGVDLIEGLGTCVCVVEGSVTITTKVGDEETLQIEEGFSCFIFSDGRGPTTFELYEEHGGPVRGLAGDGDRLFAAEARK